MSRDANRAKCYKWEREWFSIFDCHKISNRDTCRGFGKLCLKVGLQMLAARHRKDGAWIANMRATYKQNFMRDKVRGPCRGGLYHGITMKRWGWTRCVIAHEVAHFLQYAECDARKVSQHSIAGHGPEWVGIYVFLLNELVGFPLWYLEQSLAAARIPFKSYFPE
jgi:hypothetical protein